VKRAINQLVRAVREKIREVAKVETSDSDDIEELAHLFAAEAGEEDSTSSGETDPERFAYGRAEVRPRQ
jgi:hypothetical protein